MVLMMPSPNSSWINSFQHALLQDAAHASLLHGTRQQLHARIAEALESQSPDVMENQPELFARHYAEAGLAEKAAAYWGKAGRRSAARSAMTEAAAQLQRGWTSWRCCRTTPNVSGRNSKSVVPWARFYWW
jgi:predicted ATPase